LGVSLKNAPKEPEMDEMERETGSTKSNRTVLIIVLVALALVLCCVVAAIVGAVAYFVPVSSERSGMGGASETIERTFDEGASPTLVLSTFSGWVTVGAGPGEEIRIVATKKARTKRVLSQISVEMDTRRGEVRVTAEKPRALMNASVSFEVIVPEGAQVSVRTGSGRIDLEGTHGGARLETGSGVIHVVDVQGDVSAQSGSGRIEVRGVSDGDLALQSGSGTIDVSDTSGDLVAETGSGGVDVRNARGSARLSTGSGSLAYQGTPEGDCRFHTGSGTIRLRLPPELSANVELRTNSGSIRVDYPVDGVVEPKRVRGTIGDGRDATIAAETGSGRIELVRRSE
jgi:hypothetical protein